MNQHLEPPEPDAAPVPADAAPGAVAPVAVASDTTPQKLPPDAHPVRDETVMVPPATMAAMKSEAQPDAETEIRRMSRRSFLWGALAVGASVGGVRWIATRRAEDGVPWPLRRALQTNEQLSRDYFSEARLAPTFSRAQADPTPRLNGEIGLSEGFDPRRWKLRVEGLADPNAPTKSVMLAQIKALPKVEMVTELKCIEGWSMIVRWAGARLSDFMRLYPPATQSGGPINFKHLDDLPEYVGLTTPDGGYYVGLDMASALHPQTLLCYEMNGQPLSLEHGAPLRLAIPVKYGIKNIKRIGTLSYSSTRPADYWAEQGYDFYAGH